MIWSGLAKMPEEERQECLRCEAIRHDAELEALEN